MFFKSKASKPQNRIDSLIGTETRIEGNLVFTGGLRVDGQVKGNVAETEGKPSTLILSEQGRIEGVIQVSHVVVNGTVIGPVHAQEYVELQGKSRVKGDVHYKTLEMHLGAIVEGKLVHQQNSSAEPSEDVLQLVVGSS